MHLSFEFILLSLLLLGGLVWLARPFLPNYLKDHKFLKECVNLLPLLLLVFSFRSFAFESFRIPSGSMKPVFFEGDFLFIDKFSHGFRWPITGKRITQTPPKRGDIVVFRGEVKGKPSYVVKRIIGLPGDHIEYKNNRLIVNGKYLEKNFINTELEQDSSGNYSVIRYREVLEDKEYDIYNHSLATNKSYPFDDVVVPENQYFVMGNNRDHSNDSRYWGFLSDDNIVGKARIIWFSLDPNNYQIKWNRIGKVV